jgi:hypothetical protein
MATTTDMVVIIAMDVMAMGVMAMADMGIPNTEQTRRKSDGR